MKLVPSIAFPCACIAAVFVLVMYAVADYRKGLNSPHLTDSFFAECYTVIARPNQQDIAQFFKIKCASRPDLLCFKYDRGVSCDWQSYNRKQQQADLSTVMSCVRTAEGNVKSSTEVPCVGFGDE